jgi:hypothetical protein
MNIPFNFKVGKLYQFIDRSYDDFFYLVTDSDYGNNRHYPINEDNVLLLRESFMLLDTGKYCKIYKRKIWINVLSSQGFFGWFRVTPEWLEEIVDE